MRTNPRIRLTRYADLPIKVKVTLLLALTAACAAIAAGAVIIAGDIHELRTTMVNRVSGLADVVGANTAAAIVFDDPLAAQEVLNSLSREPIVGEACIYGPDGKVFATYGAPHGGAWPSPAPDGSSFDDNHISVFSTIREGGEPVGTVLLCAHADELRDRITRAVWAALAAIGGATGLAVAASSRLQRLVSDPILRLAEAAGQVSTTGDYSVRVAKQGNDEVGRLCDGFNEMLEQIQRRDRALEFLAAIEQAGDGIVITDPAGMIEYVNPSFERMTGYTRAEVVGGTPRLLKSGRQDDSFYRELWDTLKRGDVWKGHFTNRKKDGSLYEEEAAISPVRDAAGTVIKYVATKRDVTRERRVEEQMRQSQKMEAIGELAGGIAHDLNNVLTVINGHAELLIERTKGGSAPIAKSAAEILNSGRRAALLVRRVLAFSRRQMLQPKVLDLNGVVESMKDMLQCLMSERIDVSLALDPEAAFIEADPSQLEQVLVDLAVNARDAMPKGGRLLIGTSNAIPEGSFAQSHPDLRPGPYVVLSVSDTGSGMTAEVKNRIFEPFFTTKDKSKGTGLGLAMVYGIVKQSGGEIEVQSAPGQGTTFRVYLPIAGTRSFSELADAAAQSSVRGSETVLVVEDEAPVREFVSTVLKGLGYTVLEASDGLGAIRAAGEHAGPVHLAITDLAMPSMGGGMLADKLARVRPGAQVLYISAYSSESATPIEAEGPAMHVLSRPFSAATLAQKVKDVLSRDSSRTAVM
jgi:PAS domain S-box-containing protein